MVRIWIVGFGILFTGAAFAQDRQTDETPHTIHFITVEEGIKLEVIDWGGSGPPLVLLAGLGDTAHVFDKFALRLNPTFHVYGITRAVSELQVSHPPKMETILQIVLGMTLLQSSTH
jgi:hypothetical protein